MLCFRLLYAIVLSSDVFDAHACVCVVHWHCTVQLSMFNMEKRYRNKIIIIIIIIKSLELDKLRYAAAERHCQSVRSDLEDLLSLHIAVTLSLWYS